MQDQQEAKDVLSYGERALQTHEVGPEEIAMMKTAKFVCAAAINQMNDLREVSTSGEQKALATLAIRKLQEASRQMVTAITWKD